MLIKNNNASIKRNEEEDDQHCITTSCLPDKERFVNSEKLYIKCACCKQSSELLGVSELLKDQSILDCPDPECPNPKFWGLPNLISCVALIDDAVTVM